MIKISDKKVIIGLIMLFIMVFCFIFNTVIKLNKNKEINKEKYINNSGKAGNIIENTEIAKGIKFDNNTSLVNYFNELVNKCGFKIKKIEYHNTKEEFKIINMDLDIYYLHIFDFLNEILISEKYIDIKELSLRTLEGNINLLLELKAEVMVNE